MFLVDPMYLVSEYIATGRKKRKRKKTMTTLVMKEVVVAKQRRGKQDALCLGLGSMLGKKKTCQSLLVLRRPVPQAGAVWPLSEEMQH